MMLDNNTKYNRIKDSPFKGKAVFNFDLAPYTWLKTGGRADIFFIPRDTNDLKVFLENLNKT